MTSASAKTRRLLALAGVPHESEGGLLDRAEFPMRALKSHIVGQLRDVASELEPFTSELVPGTLHWNGTSYAQTAPKNRDVFALVWWSALTSIADILERQAGPLTPDQIDYLNRKLCGGMGSFNDFRLDSNAHGSDADVANLRLDTKMATLFQYLNP
jgi:hypothetical protein